MIRQEARAIVVIRKKFRRLSARMLLSARLWMILPEPAVNNDTIAKASYSMILPSSIRTMRSARRAISLLWVIITIVCLNFSPVSFKSLSTSALLLLSRFPVGSSARRSAGFVISALAIPVPWQAGKQRYHNHS